MVKASQTVVSPIYIGDTSCRGLNNIQGDFEAEGILGNSLPLSDQHPSAEANAGYGPKISAGSASLHTDP